jgi:hypothetical protein
MACGAIPESLAVQPVSSLSRRQLFAALAAIERFQWLGRRKLSQNQIRSLLLFPSTQCSSSGRGMEKPPASKARMDRKPCHLPAARTIEQRGNIVKTMFNATALHGRALSAARVCGRQYAQT